MASQTAASPNFACRDHRRRWLRPQHSARWRSPPAAASAGRCEGSCISWPCGRGCCRRAFCRHRSSLSRAKWNRPARRLPRQFMASTKMNTLWARGGTRRGAIWSAA